jgi:hypothetical protein
MGECGVCEVQLQPAARGYDWCPACSTVTASIPVIGFVPEP